MPIMGKQEIIEAIKKNKPELADRFGVIRSLEVIGEATKHIPDDVRALYPPFFSTF